MTKILTLLNVTRLLSKYHSMYDKYQFAEKKKYMNLKRNIREYFT